MKKLLRFVIENATSGKIEKQAAAKLIKMLQNEEIQPHEDIAVIGIGAKLPASNSIDEFWLNIKHNVDFIGKLPESRKSDIDEYLRYTGLEDLKETSYLEGAYLEDIDKFDYGLFRLSPKEASLMDPYQRLFLQTAWSAIEDAGYSGKAIAKTSTGVYVGYASNAKDCYQKMVFEVTPSLMAEAGVGNVTAMMPSRISYLLDLKGPTMVLDTACSSALVAVHLACQALNNGDCDMAIAGGVRMNLFPLDKEYMKFGIESSDGRTRTFDEMSDGAGMGEGIISVLLKPLNKAKRDNDNIYAVIKGSALNQDGNSIGITAPNPDSQMDVILKAWENAGINPESLSYIEAHGTGTKLGDPIELDGLERAFRRYTDKKQICAIGSVKTNVGHMYESAGLAGLMKCIMILKHKEIPPNLFYNRPNSKFNFVESPVYINSKLKKWENQNTTMKCGLSSFGFSGTNCHIVLEEPPTIQPVGEVSKVHIFTLSAKTRTTLEKQVLNFIEYLEHNKDARLGDICYVGNEGRSHFNFRLALIVESFEELQVKLKMIQKEGLKQFENQKIYFAEHKIVPQNKEERLASEITEKDRMLLNKKTIENIHRFIELKREDDVSLMELAIHYIQGADVQWDKLYKNEAVKKISLPTYPFEENRCWISIPEGQKKVRNQDEEDKFFTIGWEVEKASASEDSHQEGDILVFNGEKNICREVIEKYRIQGRTVIEVKMGDTFVEISQDEFVISGIEEDYHKLMMIMKERHITKIIHMMTLNNQTDIKSLKELEQSQLNGGKGLFYLTRAIASVGMEQDLDVILISDYTTEVNGFEERIKPENITLFAMGKVVRKEHSNISCRCIDLDDATTITDIWLDIENISEWYNVAYRRGVRYIEKFIEIDIDVAEKRDFEVKDDGVYIITGGTGGIGLEVAKYIASDKMVTLALINRTPMPDPKDWNNILQSGTDIRVIKKIEELHKLEELGAVVECYSGNVSDLAEMQSIINRIRDKHGKINGIVHGAGVGGAEVIATRSEENFNNVFYPKVQGTWIIDQLTQEDDLDFFIMFSSIASMFSAPGQGDYIAANAYLDSYSYYRNMLGKRTITINWSTWKETGMSVQHNFNIDTLFKALMIKEAISGLDKVLNRDIPRALIGEINYDSYMISLIERFMFKLSSKIRKTLYSYTGFSIKNLQSQKTKLKGKDPNQEVVLTGRENNEYTQMEKLIGSIWSDVLGFGEINIYDNFYQLGGDSISGLRISNSLEKEIGQALGDADLLAFSTIVELAKHIEGLEISGAKKVKSVYSEMEQAEPMEFYPTSSAQKRLYIVNEMEGSDNINYNIYRAISIEGSLDIKRFEKTFKKLILRHETLRTEFRLINGEPVQLVKEDVEFKIEIINTEENAVKENIYHFIRPFNLKEAPLMRVALLKLNDEKHVMLFDMHHIIADGITIDILIQDFVMLYEESPLDELKFQYKDYAVYQNKISQDGQLSEQENYWLKLLSGDIPVIDLPTDFQRPPVKNFEGNTVSEILNTELNDRVYNLAKQTGTTVYIVLLSTFYALLNKYTAQEDILIGTPVAGRRHSELEKVVGVFINTLVLRNQIKWDKSFKETLLQIQASTLEAFQYQDCQFEEFISKLKIKRDPSRNPLFDVLFVLQNVGTSEITLRDLKISPYNFEEKISRFDIMLEVIEKDKKLTLNFNYCTSLYKEDTANRMLNDYIGLLDCICQNVDIQVGDIPLQSIVDYKQVEEEWIDDEVTFNF